MLHVPAGAPEMRDGGGGGQDEEHSDIIFGAPLRTVFPFLIPNVGRLSKAWLRILAQGRARVVFVSILLRV